MENKLPKKEVMFDFLDRLRDSGVTNMFGARPYLMRQFDLPPNVASSLLSEWMKTFTKRHPEARS
jgi:hypothetical protein